MPEDSPFSTRSLILRAYRPDRTIAEISGLTSVSRPTIARILAEAGISVSPRGAGILAEERRPRGERLNGTNGGKVDHWEAGARERANKLKAARQAHIAWLREHGVEPVDEKDDKPRTRARVQSWRERSI